MMAFGKNALMMIILEKRVFVFKPNVMTQSLLDSPTLSQVS